jgi:hypothetical protein
MKEGLAQKKPPPPYEQQIESQSELREKFRDPFYLPTHDDVARAFKTNQIW